MLIEEDEKACHDDHDRADHHAALRNIPEENIAKQYQLQLKDRDDAIERLRDMKLKLSTKMVGETLEQHCETEFNKLRATAFQNAYFEKEILKIQ